jgi:hypothetical protein
MWQALLCVVVSLGCTPLLQFLSVLNASQCKSAECLQCSHFASANRESQAVSDTASDLQAGSPADRVRQHQGSCSFKRRSCILLSATQSNTVGQYWYHSYRDTSAQLYISHQRPHALELWSCLALLSERGRSNTQTKQHDTQTHRHTHGLGRTTTFNALTHTGTGRHIQSQMLLLKHAADASCWRRCHCCCHC